MAAAKPTIAWRDLPAVVCGHNDDWEWALDRLSGTVIVVRFSQEELVVWFESVKRVDTISCEWCMPGQNDAPVHNVRRLRVSAETLWRDIKRFQ
jgi:hypothetical protein